MQQQAELEKAPGRGFRASVVAARATTAGQRWCGDDSGDSPGKVLAERLAVEGGQQSRPEAVRTEDGKPKRLGPSVERTGRDR